MPDFSWWGNARVTPYMRYQLDRLDADLRRLFGVGLVANSGIRTGQEQIDVFTARYTRTPNGRYVYDIRYWKGVPWYRISPDGTVATPGTSNHEIQGNRAAVDIADTGSDAGIKSAWSERGRWLRAHCHEYDMEASGDSFGEGWHFDVNSIFNAVPGQPAGGNSTTINVPKEDTMTVTVKVNNRHYFTVGEEFLKHNGVLSQALTTAAINSPTDEVHNINLDQFWDYLDGMGIPRDVVDINTGAVLNPETGQKEGNGSWSRRRQAVALLQQLVRK